MTNPFDDPDATYLALVNPQGQYSLWPAFARVPDGWTIARGAGTRQECLDHIDGAWTVRARRESAFSAAEEVSTS